MSGHEFTWAREERLGLGYLYLSSEPTARTVEVADDIHVDLAADGTVVGVEVLCLERKPR